MTDFDATFTDQIHITMIYNPVFIRIIEEEAACDDYEDCHAKESEKPAFSQVTRRYVEV